LLAEMVPVDTLDVSSIEQEADTPKQSESGGSSLNYDNGIRYEYCTNIDAIYQALFTVSISEVAATIEE